GKKDQVSNDTQNYNPWGNIASKLFDELSHSGFKFGEYKNSLNSSISTKVNSLMVDATHMDEKFAMMEQSIEALKKSIDDKNLQITQFMKKVDIDSPTKPIDSLSTKRSASVATLTVQQLQNMMTNTIKAQYGGPPQMVSPKIEEGVIILQFGTFEPVEVSALKKTTNTSNIDDFSNEES
ncbi:hypothetical protein H5410_051004, partial [Solanum commersonii]